MKKFTFSYVLILAIFVIVGIVMVITTNKDEGTIEPDNELINKTPGYSTMIKVSELVSAQQLEKSLLNIEVSPMGNTEDIVLEIQGNDFVNEDTLLKDSYNILTGAFDIQTLNTFTIVWYAKITPDNPEVLRVTMTKDTIEQLKQKSYLVLPELAEFYEKHSTL